jgi:hypothetical protein
MLAEDMRFMVQGQRTIAYIIALPREIAFIFQFPQNGFQTCNKLYYRRVTLALRIGNPRLLYWV